MQKLLALSLLLLSFTANALPKGFYEYDLRFTNPPCKEYRYSDRPVSNQGKTIFAKPKGAYCTRDDYKAAEQQTNSPTRKLREWIRDRNTREIFFAYLSFSNKTILKELCDAVEKRNVQVSFVLDSGTRLSTAQKLLACKPKNGLETHKPKLYLRGNEHGLGYAHNKVFMVNPSDSKFKIGFSSGNMSSGVTLHHENWNFLTISSKTHFAQAHLCLREGMLHHGSSKKSYSDFMTLCHSAIPQPEESSIQSYFIPGDGNEAINHIREALAKADQIDIAAHRFSNRRLLKALHKQLKAKKTRVRILVDDDVYWIGRGVNSGHNTYYEYEKVLSLLKAGASVKYMETNHNQHLLHHNKFLVFYKNKKPFAVFTGAGNFTNSAFASNFENFYLITEPSITQPFAKQFSHLWNDLATGYQNMPTQNVMPN